MPRIAKPKQPKDWSNADQEYLDARINYAVETLKKDAKMLAKVGDYVLAGRAQLVADVLSGEDDVEIDFGG